MRVKGNIKFLELFLSLFEEGIETLFLFCNEQGFDGVNLQALLFILGLQFLAGKVSQIKVKTDFLNIFSQVFAFEQERFLCLQVMDLNDSPHGMGAE